MLVLFVILVYFAWPIVTLQMKFRYRFYRKPMRIFCCQPSVIALIVLFCRQMVRPVSNCCRHSRRPSSMTVAQVQTMAKLCALLDVFAELRKATVSFVMPVRPSVRFEQWISIKFYILSIFFSKICRENSSFIKILQ